MTESCDQFSETPEGTWRRQFGNVPSFEYAGWRQLSCAIHGDFNSIGTAIRPSNAAAPTRDFWTQCERCCERDERLSEDAEKRERQRQRLQQRLEAASIPSRFAACTLDSYVATSGPQRDAKDLIAKYADNFYDALESGDSLVLAGRLGTGKTHLAVAALRAAAAHSSVAYIPCMDLIRKVRSTWRRSADESEDDVYSHFGSDIGLLVIDEVGLQYGSDGEKLIFFDVMNRRYEAKLPTILVTNLDRKGFESVVGQRVYDRLRQTARWIVFDWESHRGL